LFQYHKDGEGDEVEPCEIKAAKKDGMKIGVNVVDVTVAAVTVV
jgi:hypothetical protein